LKVLRLDLEELSGSRAMDADEETVMEMFVKSLFLGSRCSSFSSASSISLSLSGRSTSAVGVSSSWSSASVPNCTGGGIDASPNSTFPPSPASGSTTTTTSSAGTTTSSGGSLSVRNSSPVHHTIGALSSLDETGLASASESPSSSISSWTTAGSSNNTHSSTITTTSSSSSASAVSTPSQDEIQQRQEQQQRVLAQPFAASPIPLTSISSSMTSSSASSATKAAGPMRGSYFPSSSSASSCLSSPSTYTASSNSSNGSQHQYQHHPNGSGSGSDASREAVSAFLSTCSDYQVYAVGRLMALQFLVEHQLATMPSLDCFFLGDKLFRIPRRQPQQQ
ncbi:hypothetical protein BGX23_011180, partial [Mortierella sp. AD031]